MRSERYAANCLCFRSNQVGDLVEIEETMDQHVYHKILVRHAIPCGKRLVGRNFVFQEDNDPKHSSKLCRNYLARKEAAGVCQRMEWASVARLRTNGVAVGRTGPQIASSASDKQKKPV
eukprot:Pompholyxophrys_punicea_v1_NODE_1226_length_851_cov_50.238693.p1 type:complete len:119 gc:universal NODE_1226_length_851_cov_50.238693:650-294(-)